MKYCEACKKTFPDNQIFCSCCGNRLVDYTSTSTAQSTVLANSAAVTSNTTAVYANQTAVPTNSTPSSNSDVSWLIAILVGIGALIGLLSF